MVTITATPLSISLQQCGIDLGYRQKVKACFIFQTYFKIFGSQVLVGGVWSLASFAGVLILCYILNKSNIWCLVTTNLMWYFFWLKALTTYQMQQTIYTVFLIIFFHYGVEEKRKHCSLPPIMLWKSWCFSFLLFLVWGGGVCGAP